MTESIFIDSCPCDILVMIIVFLSLFILMLFTVWSADRREEEEMEKCQRKLLTGSR